MNLRDEIAAIVDQADSDWTRSAGERAADAIMTLLRQHQISLQDLRHGIMESRCTECGSPAYVMAHDLSMRASWVHEFQPAHVWAVIDLGEEQ